MTEIVDGRTWRDGSIWKIGLIGLGVEVCRLAEGLPSTPTGKHLANHVIRSSTSPIGQYGEVQGAESRRDFIHKLGMCLKELRETGHGSN